MTEIFYRAWHKEQQKMYAVLEMHWTDTCPSKLDYLLLHGDLKVLPNEVALMRSTGIYDDNHILIYEGHIVTYSDGQGEVVYSNGMFQVSGSALTSRENLIVTGNVFESKSV